MIMGAVICLCHFCERDGHGTRSAACDGCSFLEHHVLFVPKQNTGNVAGNVGSACDQT